MEDCQEPKTKNYISKIGRRYKMLSVVGYVGKVNGRHSFRCECDCGNTCIRYSSHLNDTATSCGCKRSEITKSGQVGKTKLRDVDSLISEVEMLTGNMVICDPQPQTTSTWSLLCREHGIWQSQLRHLLRGSANCRGCHVGYGFDKTVPSTLYLFSVIKDGDVIGLKFGITNKTSEDRKLQLLRNTNLEMLLIRDFKFDDGRKALYLENAIKSNFTTHHISKHTLPSGFTETLSHEDLQSVLTFINLHTTNH